MKLFNTLTKTVEELRPLEPGKIKLYTCGPTVYDFAHIGNLRAFIFDDVLRRALESEGLEVAHVMNITDVGHLTDDADQGEDKLEKGSTREGKTVWQVAEDYVKAFEADVKELNVLLPNVSPAKAGPYARATNFIPEQIKLVEQLISKGFAYQTKQAIYFEVSKLPSYGELTGQNVKDKEVGARAEVIVDTNKRHPQDFGLWFFAVDRFANHTMRWDSPWGEGFPGWHLECSAIIHALLGDPIDIHTGGVDHIGTHHTNEMAQTEAAFGHKLSNFWVHNEFVLVDGKKMSKSLGNIYTLGDIKKHGASPLALRLLFLQAHYRSELNFTWESLAAAQTSLNTMYAWADLIFQPAKTTAATNISSDLLADVAAALSEDLNTAKALAFINDAMDKGAPNKNILEELDKILGLKLSERQDITDSQKKLINLREQARGSDDWAQADKLRAELQNQKIGVRDTENGSIWYRL